MIILKLLTIFYAYHQTVNGGIHQILKLNIFEIDIRRIESEDNDVKKF